MVDYCAYCKKEIKKGDFEFEFGRVVEVDKYPDGEPVWSTEDSKSIYLCCRCIQQK